MKRVKNLEVSSERKFSSEFDLPKLIVILSKLSKRLNRRLEKVLAKSVGEYEKSYIICQKLDYQENIINEQLKMLKEGSVDMNAFWGLPEKFNAKDIKVPQHPRDKKRCDEKAEIYRKVAEKKFFAKEELKLLFKKKNSARIMEQMQEYFTEGARKVIFCEIRNAKEIIGIELHDTSNISMKVQQKGIVLSRDSSPQEREIAADCLSSYRLISLAMIPLL